MERSWWWKAVLYGAATVLACLYLVPSVVPDGKRPAIVDKYFNKRIQKGLDLQGGLHLVYRVDINKAVSSKVDRLATDMEDQLKKKHKDLAVTVGREGRDDVTVTFKNPGDLGKLDKEIVDTVREELDEVERDAAAGRVRFRFDADEVADVEDSALRQAIETIRGRVDKFGVAEPTIIKKGTDIVVELPGLTPEHFERIKQIIGKTAQLEFKVVDDEADEYMKKVAASLPKDGPVTWDTDNWSEKDSGRPHEFLFLRAKTRADIEKFVAGLSGELAPPGEREFGYEEVTGGDTGNAVEKYWRAYLLHRRAGVTGAYLADAAESWDEMGRPEVSFTMNRQGTGLMQRLTGENVGRRMAIVLDEKVNSAPVIESQIGERGRITLGTFGDPFKLQQEVKDLVAVLRSGALPAPLTKEFETQVGPTLGADAIKKAVISMYIGAAAVILFMLIYYRLAGLIANIAMMLNVLFMMAILAGFEASLTLPGLAGLALTIGMSVDANILIYERIREELRLGKSPRTAVDTGFNRAFWTVIDANATNFVAGIVLYSYGSGPLRGFAVTLLVGIATNVITAVWISRWMFGLVVDRRGAAPATLSI